MTALRRWVAIIAAALLGSSIFAGLPAAYSQSPVDAVTVTGQVVNGTLGGPAPSGVLVLALVADGDGGLIAALDVVSDEEGRFTVEGLPAVDNAQYIFSAEYGGALYRTLRGAGDLDGELRLTVYEPTEDVSVVEVTKHVQVIAEVDKTKRTVAAIEFVRLANRSDRTLVPNLDNPAQMSFLRFSLPPQSYDLNVQSDLQGRDIIPVGTGFAVTSPVPPGEHSVEFSYFFTYEGSAVAYRQGLHQGAGIYQALVPENLAFVRVAPLELATPMSIQDTSYQVWEAKEIGPGQGLMLQFTGLPQPGLLGRVGRSMASAETWQVILPSLLGSVLAVLLLFGLLRVRWTSKSALEGGSPLLATGEFDRTSLVQEIADLDDRFESGGHSEGEYRRKRQRLKARVLESRAQTAGPQEDGTR